MRVGRRARKGILSFCDFDIFFRKNEIFKFNQIPSTNTSELGFSGGSELAAEISIINLSFFSVDSRRLESTRGYSFDESLLESDWIIVSGGNLRICCYSKLKHNSAFIKLSTESSRLNYWKMETTL